MANFDGNWDHPSDLWNWTKDKFNQASAWGGKRNAPQIGQNPYLGDWGGLIGQLQNQAAGKGPSLAGDAYKQASAEGLAQQQTMAAGGSSAQARQAGINMGRINQSQAFGYSNARLQEQLAAQQALVQALSGAGNAWFQPQQANLNAQLNTPTNWQQLTNTLSQFGSAYGSMFGGPGGKGGAGGKVG